VEGYSNLLWVLVVAAGGLVHSDLVLVARVLGFVFTATGLGLLLASGVRRAGLAAVVFSGEAALSLALCGSVAAWSIGGLEQPLLAVLLLAAVVASESLMGAEQAPPPRAPLPMSVALGLLCIVRPDGPIFTVAAALSLFIAYGLRRASFRLACSLVLLPIVLTLAQVALRKVYYGDFLPNTYHAKGTFTWTRLLQGRKYIQDSLRPLGAIWVAGLLSLGVAVFSKALRRRTLFALVAWALWLAYVLRIGGDIFPQRRQLVALFALQAFLLLALLQWLWDRRGVVRFSAWLLGPVLLIWFCVAQTTDRDRRVALGDTWQWTGKPVGRFLRKVFWRQRPLAAVDAAGALPYYYELPCLDMLGLNDRYIAHHPPPDIGRGLIGHELGDGQYVLSRKPDLIAFWTPVGGDRPQWRSGREMVVQPSFREFYQATTFETDDASHTRTRLWIRRRDSRIGVQQHDDRLEVPGYLLQGAVDVVRFDPKDGLYVALKPDGAARAKDLRISPGRFTVQVLADHPIRVEVREGGRTLALDDTAGSRWRPMPRGSAAWTSWCTPPPPHACAKSSCCANRRPGPPPRIPRPKSTVDR
jgi:hypothetical protein